MTWRESFNYFHTISETFKSQPFLWEKWLDCITGNLGINSIICILKTGGVLTVPNISYIFDQLYVWNKYKLNIAQEWIFFY